jgi:hypothetical protein
MSRKITPEEIERLAEYNKAHPDKYVSIEAYQDNIDWIFSHSDSKIISEINQSVFGEELTFLETIKSEELTPRKLIAALQKIPEEYMDNLIFLSANGVASDKLNLSMVIDDVEEARLKWDAGNPDYCLFLDVN